MSDRYMRVVLTVIAVCLVWLCIRDTRLFPAAQAQPAPNPGAQPVAIVRIDTGALQAALSGAQLVKLQKGADGSVTGAALPVFVVNK